MPDDPTSHPTGRATRARSAAAVSDGPEAQAAELRRELETAAVEIRDEIDASRDEIRDEVTAARDELTAVARNLAVLWGVDDPPTRGPKATFTRDAIVTTAIEIADADGIEAVSMRAVAKALGVGTMSLYRHVPSKEALVALMIDRINGEAPDLDSLTGTWREKLEALAWGDWKLAHRHPWVLVAAPGMVRPVAGPNSLAAYESWLAVAAETGLTGVDVVQVVSAVHFLVEGAIRSAVDNATIEQRTGVSNEEWWAAQDQILEQTFDPERYPAFTAASEAGGFGGSSEDGTYQDPIDIERHFRVALATLLDGIEARLTRRDAR